MNVICILSFFFNKMNDQTSHQKLITSYIKNREGVQYFSMIVVFVDVVWIILLKPHQWKKKKKHKVLAYRWRCHSWGRRPCRAAPLGGSWRRSRHGRRCTRWTWRCRGSGTPAALPWRWTWSGRRRSWRHGRCWCGGGRTGCSPPTGSAGSRRTRRWTPAARGRRGKAPSPPRPHSPQSYAHVQTKLFREIFQYFEVPKFLVQIRYLLV